ncbi:hypothetical protein [Luteimonas mephitis]|uniref:hypothetical protein n=1 Tax=Luteimonas mephitis TaxID=83615 RepID=UPI003A931B77
MSLFELTFSLSALILGLALTHMASNVYKLAHAGRRVRWAPEPLLQAGIVLLVVVQVWVSQWEYRTATEITYWQILLQTIKLLVLYVAAASCLPEIREDESKIDLYTHYDHTRRLSFGALALGLALFAAHEWTGVQTFQWRWAMLTPLIYMVPYVFMMFVRLRWFNIVLLAAILAFYGSVIMEYRLSN